MSQPTRPALSPLVKWTGGKRSEIATFKPAYPSGILRLIEPFSGGAAVSFENNAPHTILNDVSCGLVEFYKTVKDAKKRTAFVVAMGVLDDVRKAVTKDVTKATDKVVQDLFSGSLVAQSSWVTKKMPGWAAYFPEILQPLIIQDITANLTSKAVTRIPGLEKKRGTPFSITERRQHLETAIQAGIYTTLRRVYNGQAKTTVAWKVASWYAVRALCYSGMFRYGKNNAFNVPYGGIGYNSRDFSTSIAQITHPDMVDFFKRSDIYQEDFETLFSKIQLKPGDFIFVDPPYDSTFSKYNADGSFTAEDQKRLADFLKKTATPWMLVVKNTPFILALYQAKHLFRGVFSKSYQVNFRNRHDRGVEHLVVTNYPIPKTASLIKRIP